MRPNWLNFPLHLWGFHPTKIVLVVTWSKSHTEGLARRERPCPPKKHLHAQTARAGGWNSAEKQGGDCMVH